MNIIFKRVNQLAFSGRDYNSVSLHLVTERNTEVISLVFHRILEYALKNLGGYYIRRGELTSKAQHSYLICRTLTHVSGWGMPVAFFSYIEYVRCAFEAIFPYTIRGFVRGFSIPF